MEDSPCVSIVISNRNSFEGIQLAIESVRCYTRYPNYKILVFDDASYLPGLPGQGKIRNDMDWDYLDSCQSKGWIELYRNASEEPKGHGGALNQLLHTYCDTDYVVILDCDTQIKDFGWLKSLMGIAMSDRQIIAVVDWRQGGFARRYYRTGLYEFWFGLINMQAYRDGMQVNWERTVHDRRLEPYVTEMADYYPPDDCIWTDYFNAAKYIVKDEFDADKVCNDPGSKLYIQVKYFNPKGYRVVPLPPHVKAMYYHVGHLSMISIPSVSHPPHVKTQREEKYRQIKSELRKLRDQC